MIFEAGDIVIIKPTGKQQKVVADYGPNFYPRFMLDDDFLYSKEDLDLVIDFAETLKGAVA